MNYLLDTAAFSDLMREHPNLQARLAGLSVDDRAMMWGQALDIWICVACCIMLPWHASRGFIIQVLVFGIPVHPGLLKMAAVC